MSVKISIPSAFRRHTEGLDHYECEGSNLTALLDSLGGRFLISSLTCATNKATSAAF